MVANDGKHFHDVVHLVTYRSHVHIHKAPNHIAVDFDVLINLDDVVVHVPKIITSTFFHNGVSVFSNREITSLSGEDATADFRIFFNIWISWGVDSLGSLQIPDLPCFRSFPQSLQQWQNNCPQWYPSMQTRGNRHQNYGSSIRDWRWPRTESKISSSDSWKVST